MLRFVAGINKRRGLASEFLKFLVVLDGRSAKLSVGLPSGLILSGLSRKVINSPIYTFLITPLRTGQCR
jgi:hypothetical protein